MLLLVVSCNTQEPSASFQYAILQGKTVNFLNASIDAESYHWEFGDGKGSSSTSINPEFTYAKGGVYTVVLTAYSKKNKKYSQHSKKVIVPYDKAYIKKITVTEVPNISSWDISSNPDIYMAILSPNPNNNVLINSGVLNNATVPFAWTITPGSYFVPTSNDYYFLNLYDQDTSPVDPDDDMGYISFRINDYPSFPSQITKTQNGITATFDMEWE